MFQRKPFQKLTPAQVEPVSGNFNIDFCVFPELKTSYPIEIYSGMFSVVNNLIKQHIKAETFPTQSDEYESNNLREALDTYV